MRHLRSRFVLLSPYCDDVWADISPKLGSIGDVTIVQLAGQSTIEDHARSISELIDERSYVVGFCMGGVVALAATRISPQVAGIVLISSTPLADSERQRRVRLGKIERLGIKAETGGAKGDTSYAELATSWMLSRQSLSHDMARLRANQILGEFTPQMALDNHMAMLSRPDLGDEFLAFGHRILMFIGRQDRILDVRSVTDFAARAPGVQTIVAPDCGHLIPIEDPGLIVNATENWVSTL